LIELLVVIATVSILASFLLPVLARSRDKATAASCLNNLKQWGLATHLYGADHNDDLPPEGKPTPLDKDLGNPAFQAWYVQLPELLRMPRYADMAWRTNSDADPGRSIWICPLNRRRCNTNSATSHNLFHYCLNENVNGTGANNRPTKISSIRRTSSVVWLYDSKNLPAVGNENYVHTNLHARGANFLLLDGHARRFPNTEYWDFTANKGRTDNPVLVWVP